MPGPDPSPSPRRRWWPVGVAAVVVTGLATAAYLVLTNDGFSGCVDTTKPDSYTIAKLKHDMDPVAVSPNGEYVVGTSRSGADRFVLWHNGRFSTMKYSAEMTGEPSPKDVNDTGVVVGEFIDHEADERKAWKFEDGGYQRLEPPGELSRATAWASAINADGTVVGGAIELTGNEAGYVPVKWEAGEITAQPLEHPKSGENGYSQATDISAAGIIVGNVSDDAWLWEPDGKGRKLTTSPESSPAIAGDWVVVHDRKWNIAEDREYPRVGGDDFPPRFNTVDSCGRLYGIGESADGHAVVYDDQVRKLPAFSEPVAEDYPDDPDEPMGEVYAGSADGSVLVGESYGWFAIWTYT